MPKRRSKKQSYAKYLDDVLDPKSTSKAAQRYRTFKKMDKVAQQPMPKTIRKLMGLPEAPLPMPPAVEDLLKKWG